MDKNKDEHGCGFGMFIPAALGMATALEGGSIVDAGIVGSIVPAGLGAMAAVELCVKKHKEIPYKSRCGKILGGAALGVVSLGLLSGVPGIVGCGFGAGAHKLTTSIINTEKEANSQHQNVASAEKVGIEK